MAAGKQASASSLPLGSIATLLLFVAGIIIPNVPLESQRPRELEPAKDRIVGIQDADARLWQDPFSAAVRHLSKIEKPQDLKYPKFAQDGRGDSNHSCARLRKSDRTLLNSYKKLVVLGVMVIGSPYAEAAELRRRYRYATLSALGTFGFIPTDSENIGYFVPPQSQEYSPSSGIVPFEFLVPARKDGPGVLLLWLEEEAFVGPHPPLATLNNLLRLASPEGGAICAEDSTTAPLQPGQIEYRIIGPVSSTVLKYMLEQVSDTLGDTSKERDLRELVTINGAPVEIYSASATSALESFLERPSGRSTNMSTEQLENRMNLVRAIGTDAKLAEYLMTELERRGIFPGKLEEEGGSRHYIALISEWDEVYGQQLPITITKAASAVCNKGKVTQHCDDEEPEWAIRYSYMRGLDGQTAVDPGTRDKAAGRDKNDPGGAEKTPGAMPAERADGNSQFDYLRRLANTLEERNTRLKSAGKGEIKAVGVLGTDAYDKLLVLQALRKSLPKATFFTTDLDARLLHTDQYQWSRNLIVVSSYGLTLDPALQKSTPPFRDSYQTAVYLATLLALNQNDLSQKRDLIRHWLATPRIFEIGRTHAIDLSDPVPKEQLRECAPAHLWDCMRVHPERAVTQPRLAVLGILTGLLVLGAALLYQCSWKTKIFLHRYWFCVLTVYAVLLGLGWLFSRFILSDPGQEPFVLIEGISIWPTELIRLAACGLAVAFIFRSCHMLKKNAAEINAEFFPGQNPGPQKSDTSSSSWKRMEHDDSPVDMFKLWREYLYHCRPERVSWRVFRAAIIFFGLSALLVFPDLPMVPYRGELSLWVDRAVLALSIAGFVVLLFFVLDQIRLCDRLVRVLYAGTSAWPKETLQKQSVKNDSGREWIDIQFVAKRTEEVGKLVYYPFVVLVLLIVARSSLFDHWHLPYGLAAVFVLSLVFTLTVAIQLRRSAEHARSIALQHLFRLRLQYLSTKKENARGQNQTEAIIAEIATIRTGAFRPFTEQPLVQAILIPLGGYGGISLIEYLAFLK